MKKSTKKFTSTFLAAASVAGIVVPATQVLAEEVTFDAAKALVDAAKKAKDFAAYNKAYAAVMQLKDEAGKAKLLAELAPLWTEIDTAEVQAIRKVFDELAKDLDLGNYYKAYDMIEKMSEGNNKEYVRGELAGWGHKGVFTADVVAATDAINKLWTEPTLANEKVAQEAIAKVKNAKSVTWLNAELAKAGEKIVRELKVESVKADNLKEIVVTFSKPVDKITAENKAAYSLTKGIGSEGLDLAKLSDDGMSVTLVPTVALTNQASDYKLAISGVKEANGTKSVTVKDLKFTPVDASLPTVQAVESLGNKAVKITFSEPVTTGTATVASTFKIDDKVVSGTLSASGRDVIIKLFNTLTAGSHKITINNNVKDFANYQLIEVTKDFDVVSDTVAPTIAQVKDVTLESATVIFSEDVQDTEALSKDNYLWKQGTTDKKASSVTKIDSKTFKVSFADNKLPGYTTDLYVKNVKDFSGNTIASDTKIAVTATLDQARPEVLTSVFDESGRNKITLTFNKTIDSSSFKASNVVIKDKDGKVVSNGYTAAIADKSVVINFSSALSAGTYTFELSGLKDTTLLQNAMLPYSVSITAKNVSAPKAADTITGALPNYIITFDKAMDTESSYSVLSPENYYITYSTSTASNITGRLPEGTNISPINDNKGVIITLPSGVTAVTELVVQGVKDTDGNLLDGYAKKYTTSNFVSSLGAVAAKATGSKTILVKMNQPVGSINNNAFTYNGAAVEKIEIDSTDNTLVKVTLTSAIKADLSDAQNLVAVPTTGAVINATGITGANLVGGTIAGSAIQDAIAPSIILNSDNKIEVGSGLGIDVVDTPASSTHTITVNFTEKVKAKNDAKLGENFKLYKADGTALEYGLDYTIPSMAAVTGDNKVVITLKDDQTRLIGYDGTIRVVFDNANGNIIDVTTAVNFDGSSIDSKALGFDTDSDAKNQANIDLIKFNKNPILKTAKFVEVGTADDTWKSVGEILTLTFDENVKLAALADADTSMAGIQLDAAGLNSFLGASAAIAYASTNTKVTVATNGKTVTLTISGDALTTGLGITDTVAGSNGVLDIAGNPAVALVTPIAVTK